MNGILVRKANANWDQETLIYEHILTVILFVDCLNLIILILIMNFIFCTLVPKSWVSRSKTLLKRRKIAIKGRTISAKKLE